MNLNINTKYVKCIVIDIRLHTSYTLQFQIHLLQYYAMLLRLYSGLEGCSKTYNFCFFYTFTLYVLFVNN